MSSRYASLATLAAGLAASLALPLPAAIAALFFPLLALLVGPRLHLSATNQALLSTAAAFLGLLIPTIVQEPARLHNIALLSERRELFFFAVHLTACARCLIARPRRGMMLTIVAIVVALTAAGGARSGLYFPALAALSLGFSLAALSHHNPGREERSLRSAQATLVTLGIVAVATGCVAAAAIYLPALQEAAIARHYQRMRDSRVGFSDHLALGDLNNVLQDDTVVLRLRGENQPDLLRGAVFTEYLGRRWDPPRKLPAPELLETSGKGPRALDNAWLELEHAEPPERYFLPLDAHSLETTNGEVARDELGVHQPPDREFSKRLWFKRGGTEYLAPPGSDALWVSKAIGNRIEGLLREWGALKGAPLERMSVINQALRSKFDYELVARRPHEVEPVLEFLFESRKGHCEYFASAAALLGRVAGVPTRVVTGYRVAEHSRFGYSIVRKRHAHAWIEAWSGSHWVTFDPTPAGPLLAGTPDQTPLFRALLDRVATAWESLDDRLDQATALQFGVALVFLLGLFVVVRALRVRDEAKRGGTAEERPLDGYVLLAERLARRGLRRDPFETLNDFSDRVLRGEELSTPERETTVQLLRDYADLRYGRTGAAVDVDERMSSFATQL